MKTATAKELRQRTAALLEQVRRGSEVVITYRGKSVAVLRPLEREAPGNLSADGFGMWKGRDDMRDVQRWIDSSRKPRFRK